MRTTYSVAFFIALLSTALALGAALAHVFALPNKIGLAQDQYFIAQVSYRGWDRLAFLLVIEFLSILAVIFLSWRDPRVFWPAVFALLSLMAAQAVFWAFTYPANVATNNWTAIPENWDALRRQWEYSHAVGAAFQLLTMSALIIAALSRDRQPPMS